MPATNAPIFTTPAPTFDDVWKGLMKLEQIIERNTEEARQRSKEMNKRMQVLSKQLSGHANRLGEFVQEMVKPAAVRLFQERNLPVHQVISNHKVLDDSRQFVMEIDLIVINTDMLIALECKSKLTQEDM